MNLRMPVCEYTSPSRAGGMPSAIVGGDPQIAGESELEPAADRVAVEGSHGRVRVGLDCVDRRAERMRDQPLGFVGKRRPGSAPMSYPAENVVPSPVMITQRASSFGSS